MKHLANKSNFYLQLFVFFCMKESEKISICHYLHAYAQANNSPGFCTHSKYIIGECFTSADILNFIVLSNKLAQIIHQYSNYVTL